MYQERNILCIDLKSFYASCECIRRGLDPFNYPLVVANINQGMGAMTLAVTPYLKNLGVKSRGRIFEIDKRIKYKIVNPHMNLYINNSKEVIKIYLDYIEYHDLLIYSVDECFLDVTDYLKMYNKTDIELAKDIMNTIYNKTGLTATCGIGPNMFIAKVAMDIEAKKCRDNIAKWNYTDVTTKLWNLTNLTDFWGIGQRMEKRLNKIGIYSVKDLANTNKYLLKDKFGIIGLELWNHANGIDTSIIKDYYELKKSESYSKSKTLLNDYYEYETKIIIRELVENLVYKLKNNNKFTSFISLSIFYSKEITGSFHDCIKLDKPTDSMQEITYICELLFLRHYDNKPVRKVCISIAFLTNKEYEQLCLFNKSNKQEKNIFKCIIDIKNKFGKNSVLFAESLLFYSTIKSDNEKFSDDYE